MTIIPGHINTLEKEKFLETTNNEVAVRTSVVDSSGNGISINTSGQLKVVLDGKVCTGNSTKTALLANATFTGTTTGETLDYALIFVSVFSNVASATNGLVCQISSDGTTWRDNDYFTIPANTEKTFSLQPNRRYFRIKYINGGTNQTTFDLETIYKKTNSKPSSHRIQDSIYSDDDATLNKTVLTGENPTGTFVNFQATTSGNFKTSIEELENGISVNSNSQLKTTVFNSTGEELFTSSNPIYTQFPSTYFDCFGRFVTSQPKKLMEYSATYPLDIVRYFTFDVDSSGTYVRDATKTQITLTTTTDANDKVVVQTRRNIQYNKGNSQEIFIIYRPNPLPNRRERWGYFDANNGVFFEHDGTNPRLVIRSNTSGSIVDTTIERAAWLDPLNGTGASGLTINFEKQTVFKIDFGWLSSRGVRFFVDIGGTFVLLKQWYISNTMVVPFMKTACLPIRFEVDNTGVTSESTSSSFSCFAVQSSGATDQEGPVRFRSNSVTPTSISATETIVSGIRVNSSYPNASIQIIEFDITPASGNTFAYYKLVYNPTLVGDNWTANDMGIYDYLTSVTSYTGGNIIGQGHVNLAQTGRIVNIKDLFNDVYLGFDLDGTADAVILTLQTNTGLGTIFYNLEFKEFT